MAADIALLTGQEQRKRVIGDPDKIIPYRFKPKQSGNPRGRPKGLVAAALFKQLRRFGGKNLEKFIARVIGSATKGDPKAFTAIRDSIDGRPTQSIDMHAELSVSLADRVKRARKAGQERRDRWTNLDSNKSTA